MKNILIIDDDKDLRFLLKRHLNTRGFQCYEASTQESSFEILDTNVIDLVLCDLNLKKEKGQDILMSIKERKPSLPVIIITGYSNVRTAVEVMKHGAADYLLKPLIPEDIVSIIHSRIQTSTEQGAEPAPTVSEPYTEERYVLSPNDSFQAILKQIDLVAPTDYSVIIYGESGSGKEAFAQEIHKRSKRKAKPFVAIDCGALSKELSASLLFGHEKGAFTGALDTKKGAFETAEGGTIFLDEISNLSYDIQVSLLRVMQERKTRRVGGTKDIPIDIRVIVASNKKLWEASKQGLFREDLYHRFNEFSIDVLPLRERKNDIVFYADHFRNQSNRELNKRVSGFTDDAMKAILKYNWPGNLRQLKNLIKRSVLISESDTIGIEILPEEFIVELKRSEPA
ncbi:MAG TPA: sigma-54 dependent transcriptional regulator [Ohtaekwangia sp.]|nr:sigma-54 dependent transcriptional regulator [Ohtaekwangia sp.]